MHDYFRSFAQWIAHAVGSPWSFVIACLVIVVWLATGPLFNYSDTWQLVVNTGTSVLTFLIVFLIQNTQNRDTKVLQLKLDELIRGLNTARNHFIDLEQLSDDQLEALHEEFKTLRSKYGDSVVPVQQHLGAEVKKRFKQRG